MNAIQRTIVAAAMACVPLLAPAQGFKCKQADGSVSYQDHACAPGSASSIAIQTDMSGIDISTLPGFRNLDASCQQSAKHTVSVCLPQIDATLKRCYHARLSAQCYLQMTAGPGSHRDAACVQAASPCISQGLGDAQRCVLQQLPSECQQQVAGGR